MMTYMQKDILSELHQEAEGAVLLDGESQPSRYARLCVLWP